MTIATFLKVDEKYRVIVDGHANYNPGNDPVCAACSVLIYTLDNILTVKQIAHTSYTKHGYMTITAEPKAAPYIEMIYIGYMGVAENYPNNVKVRGNWNDMA